MFGEYSLLKILFILCVICVGIRLLYGCYDMDVNVFINHAIAEIQQLHVR